MNREEAIAIIRKEYLCVDRDCDIDRSCGKCDLMMPSKEPILEAYKVAIKALEQEPCEDAIDRKLVCAFIGGLISDDVEREKGLEYIRNMPPVNPQEPKTDSWSIKDVADTFKKHGLIREQEPKTGHWIPIQEIIGVDKEGNEISTTVGYKCSKCLIVHPRTSIFCPNCGAKMIEPQEVSEKK